MKWTKEQETAINTTGVNITVSASAGAGKTAVLVERLMKRIIKDKISIDKIVALTFTDAAAAEMKNRLMQALSKAYTQNPDDTYLKKQLVLLPSAKITTIHSFCLSILKDYYYVLQIDPNSLNNILDEPTIAKIKTQAFDYVLENYNYKKLQTTMYHLSNSALNTDLLKDIVTDLSDKASGHPQADKWLDKSIEIYNDFDSLQDIPQDFKQLLWADKLNIANQLETLAFKLRITVDDLGHSLDISSQKLWVDNVISLIEPLKKSIAIQNYFDYKNIIEKIASIKHKTIQKQRLFQLLRDEFVETLNQAVNILYEEKHLLKDLAHNKEIAQNIVEMVKIYNNQYKKYLDEENGITFDDMEILTYQLLTKNNQEIAKMLKKEIEDILVDEFQDTNTLQNEIIKLIGRDDNIFRVGDVKQSIYRFRGAKPKLMQDLINKKDSKNHKTIFLTNNFRSKDDIVQFNNHFFSKLMNFETFDSSYKQEDFVSPGTKQQKFNSQPAELHLINTSEQAYEDFDDDYNLTTNEFRAQYITKQILNLYKNDTDAKWNKFTVLVSSHSSKQYLRQAFQQANIPYFMSMPEGFYESYGVSTVTAFLKLVLDPSDTISLMAILINLYGYSENEITKHYLVSKNLFEVAKKLNENILNKIMYYHKNQAKIKLTDIINDVLNINDFYESQISQQSKTNLDLFYESALNYEQRKSGIYGFLLEIEFMKEEKTSEASSISSEDNVVNVTTIHGSKGLQYDTVFLWSKSANRNRDTNAPYIINDELGLGLKSTYLPQRIVKDNLANYLIRSLESKENLEEEMRLLYVALTRAQNRLYIIDTFKLDKEKHYYKFDHNDVYKNIGFTGWVSGITQNYPSKHLLTKYQDSFEYDRVEKLNKPILTIKRLKPIEKKPKTKLYPWPIKKLDLSVDESIFDLGTMIHDTIENLPEPPWSENTIKKIEPNISHNYINKLILLSRNDFFLKISSEKVYKEYPFICKIDNIYERGIIDYLAIKKDDVYIVDFKTDNLVDEKELLARYTTQLSFYKKALRPIFIDKNIKAFIYSFYLDQFIEMI